MDPLQRRQRGATGWVLGTWRVAQADYLPPLPPVYCQPPSNNHWCSGHRHNRLVEGDYTSLLSHKFTIKVRVSGQKRVMGTGFSEKLPSTSEPVLSAPLVWPNPLNVSFQVCGFGKGWILMQGGGLEEKTTVKHRDWINPSATVWTVEQWDLLFPQMGPFSSCQ